MMFIEIVSLILLGIAAAALFLGRGNAGINVTLTQPPNVLGMYIRAAIGRLTKHRWLKDAKKLPAIQVGRRSDMPQCFLLAHTDARGNAATAAQSAQVTKNYTQSNLHCFERR